MDPIQLLETDHRKVKKLLAQGQSAVSDHDKQSIFDEVHLELTVHEIIEEEIFYPACRSHPKAKDIVLEGIEEHHVVDELLGELTGLPTNDETWDAKFKVMRENVEHHIEEEEGTMFPQAKQALDGSDLRQLGDRMEARKEEAMRQERAAAS